MVGTRSQRFLTQGLLALGLSLTAIGCSSGPVQVESSTPPPTEEKAEQPKNDDPAQGTRENPYPAGSTAKWDQSSIWTFTVGETNPNAWEIIRAADEWALAPESGKVYVTANIRVAANQDDGEAYSPSGSVVVDYVTASGNSIDGIWCGTTLPAPGDLWSLGDMYAGSEADFMSCAAVPESDVAGGTWRLSYNGPDNMKVFFAGAS